MLRLVPPSQYVPPPGAPAGQPQTPGTSEAGGPVEKARPKRVVEKPWNLMGISYTRWNREHTKWGKQGLTKKEYLKREGISPYRFGKLERGERMMAHRERETAEAAATGGTASQKPGTRTKRTPSKAAGGHEAEDLEELEKDLEYDEEYADDEEEDDDDAGSFDRDGAPSPDPDADYRPS